MERTKSKWPSWKGVSIAAVEFEGHVLPGFTLLIDVAANELVEDPVAVWFFRFTVCVGASRTEDSATIILNCETLLHAIEREKQRLFALVQSRLAEYEAEQVIRDWVEALTTIIALASTRPQCTWIGEKVATAEDKGADATDG